MGLEESRLKHNQKMNLLRALDSFAPKPTKKVVKPH
jgi:hypothetical protein